METLAFLRHPTNYISHTVKKNRRRPLQHNGLCFKNHSKFEIPSSPAKLSMPISPFSFQEDLINFRRQISRYCEDGKLREAMNLFDRLSDSGSQLDSDTYCSLLQLCADHKSLADGKRVHSSIRSCEVKDDVIGSKLVIMYLKCDDLKAGRRVFDGMTAKSALLWNMLMNEYAKLDDFEEAMLLFVEMQREGVNPDSYGFSCVLKCCSAFDSIGRGEQVHSLLTKSGFGSHVTVGNALVSFYLRCARVESAREVFVRMPDRDVISWNALMGGLVFNGKVNEAFKALREMIIEGILLDIVTNVTVLLGCVESGHALHGKEIHGYAIKAGFSEEITVSNSLVDTYAKCGELEYAIRLFKQMPRRNVVSWTSIISGYARNGYLEKAIQLFNEMELSGVKPDLFTITSILHACTYNSSLQHGKGIHGYIQRNGLESNLAVANALIDVYAKCGSMGDARSVFDKMNVRDKVSWNTIIGGYSKNRLPNEALTLFCQMQKEVTPNAVTMACTLPACASLSSLERGREIHANILRNGYLSDGFIDNALVDMYAKCGALNLARAVFDLIPNRNLVSWTAMIAGYGMHGHGEQAISLFNRMQEARVVPDQVSYISLLYACSHSGLVDEGTRLFASMKNLHGIVPKLEHYACMVDLLGRAGHLNKAYKFIQTMPIKPDSTVWGTLLCACRLHRDVALAEKVAEKVFELEPENTGYYVLLSNIYTEAEQWESVKKLRIKMTNRGLKKNPGCSWIEVKGKMHIFVCGDRNSKTNYKQIQTLLEKINGKMKEEGYSSNKRYALIDLDDQGKEDALCGHSEKLAMAFGILNSPRGKPIRVAKNLRVCGDCHEVAKFMSKIFGREIILRDSSRFHHFTDGRCSCRSYW